MEPTITEFAHLKIPLDEIREATNNFAEKNIIGKGGFGNVYKGKITRSGESIKIVARRLGRNQWQGDVEFWTEISTLSTLDHEYIVSIIGYCDEKGEKIIINRLYPKGSLVTYLNDPTTLSWIDRMHISRCVVSAIKHIHNDLSGSYYIIHRNVNSSTIVLDDNIIQINARLSGFEHSIKHSVDRKDQVYLIEAIGTLGYIDPTIETTQGVTHKSDIYSLGVVLFEMLCGRKAFQDNKLLAPLAKNHYENGTLSEIIHPGLWNQMSPESLKKFSEAAYSCLQEDPTQRPDAAQLFDKLSVPYHPFITSGQVKDENVDQDKLREFELMFASFPPGTYKVKNMEHLRIEASDILFATEVLFTFSQAFEGHSGFLFKAELKCFNREHPLPLASINKNEVPKKHYTAMVKYIDTDTGDFREKYGEEFLSTEIEILRACNHVNIEFFLGFSEMYSRIFLVSEFVSTNYLSSYLDNPILTWETRLKICIDVARGLNYLHNEMDDQKMVIHHNINSKNIVLDNNWSAKIVEFGQSVFLPPNQDDNALHLDVVGATIYMDPEYVETGKLKRESDVFSFGVLMLEILCGMSADKLIDYEGGNDKGLAHLVRRRLDEGIIKRVSSFVSEILCRMCVGMCVGMSTDELIDNEGGNDKGLAHLVRRQLDKGKKKSPSNFVPKIPCGMSDGMSDGMFDGMFAEMSAQMSTKMSTGMSTEMSARMKCTEMSAAMPDGMFIKMCADMFADMAIDEMYDLSSRKVSDGTSSRMSSRMSTGMSTGMFTGMPAGMPTGMFAGMPDGMSFDELIDYEGGNDKGLAHLGRPGLDEMSVDELIDNEGGNDTHLGRLWLDKGMIRRMVNPRVKGENANHTFILNNGPNEDFLETFITIMLQCLELKQNQRPTMQVVIMELEKALSFQENNKDSMRMSFQDIKSATYNFSNCIGGGGFGGVFKGEVAHGPYGFRHIVAKKLDKSQGQGEKQFYNELQILYEYKHDNIIGLVGYSNETNEKIIVYEHTSNGSLDKHLNNARLTWRNRLKICINVAAGLDFLHGGVGGQDVVIHRDIKTANVLLFDDWKAKLGDFGLSLVSPIKKDSNYAIDHACGTLGYVDDSYLKSSILTKESDIYSFGVVLFEILYGTQVYAIPRNKSLSLLSFVKQNIEEGKQGDLIFRAIKDEIMSKSLNAYLTIVYKCLDDDREKRPTSKEVLIQLKNALELQEDTILPELFKGKRS